MTNVRHPQLSGLGRNPAAPEDVLVRLAAHAAGRHGLEMRRGLLADAVVAALLAHGNRHTAVHLRGDRVSPLMRRRIAQHPDPDIRDAYANFVRHSVDRQTVRVIGELEEVFGAPRATLVSAADPKLRAAVAHTWHDRPITVQARLVADPDPRVREAATRREKPGVPQEWRDRCLADPASRANVARYVPLTPAQFALLMQAEDEEVYQAVAGNPHLSAAMVAQLLEIDDPFVRIAVAQSRHVDAPTRDRLYALVQSQRADGSVDAEIALDWIVTMPNWLRDVPLDERMSYLDCSHPTFRQVLASCQDLPEEAWRRLDDDSDVQVRRIAARRPDAPAAVLERLVRTHGEHFHIRPLIIEHPNFPRHALRTFVDEPNASVQYVALQDPQLPAEDLHRLATAGEARLRRGAARHPNVTHALLEQLLSDPDPDVADEASANSLLPLARMHRILTDADL